MTSCKMYPHNTLVSTNTSNHTGTPTLRKVHMWIHTPAAMKLTAWGGRHKRVLSEVVGRRMKKVKENKRYINSKLQNK